MQVFKSNITKMPTYLDGKFIIYSIKQTEGYYPVDYIKKENKRPICFEELSISDNLRFDAEQRDKKLTIKIRISQDKEINSLNVLKIGEEYHKVFNAYHFTNRDGFRQTDITLEEYQNVKLEGEV